MSVTDYRGDIHRFDEFIERLPARLKSAARRAVMMWVAGSLEIEIEETNVLQFTSGEAYVRFVITEGV